MAEKPLCFVLMPFRTKPDPTGGPPIDFNRVYEEGIKPAIVDAGLEPIRADEEKTGGVIHKPMFERLLLCEYAVADLTTANANVFYELGVRHTARPNTTLSIFAQQQPIPFDVNFLRSLAYDLGENNAFPAEKAVELRTKLAERLATLRAIVLAEAPIDSPLFQLLGEWQPGDLSRLKTDVFRQRVQANEELRRRIDDAVSLGKNGGISALDEIRKELAAIEFEAGIVVDLFLAYRSLKGWGSMIGLYEEMPETLKRQILVREQLAFALNRRAGEEKNLADRDRALALLEAVEQEQGPSAETCGLIGRIYKDRWDETRGASPREARGHLKKAVDAYLRGFQADPRDAYPGINAVTLLDIQGDEKSRQQRDELVPVVRFAVLQRLRSKEADYWDHATLLELAVLGSDKDTADDAIDSALAAKRASWEPETTARNLKLIREARASRGEDVAWLDELLAELDKAAQA